MKEILGNRKAYVHHKMKFYMDRGSDTDFAEIADQCVNGILVLWDTHYFDINGYEGNLFQHKFKGNDVVVKKEYLFAMDYLTYVLSSYKKTGDKIYKITFEKIINQFYEYLKTNEPVYDELPVYAQSLLFIKALDILGSIPHQEEFLGLLIRYAQWLDDDKNYIGDNNHGIFEDFALLHISILFRTLPEAVSWQEHAVRRINNLFEIAYYNDFTNNENSLMYFQFNNDLYSKVVQFCKYYGIAGTENLENGLEKAEEAFITFSHKDCSLPLIGDGHIFSSRRSNGNSCLFSDIGIAVLKINEIYVSFKCKTNFQAHAHIDVSSITARYKNTDFLIDSGQYNYDRYTPANRFMRSAAGHSGIFPIFADNMFQKEFCDSLKFSSITVYEQNETNAFVKGEYQLRDVCVQRGIVISAGEILVKDSWHCEKTTVMRQRFVLPKELIEKSKFIVSQRTLETEADNVKIKFQIISDLSNILTVVQFGIAAPQYNAYEETMLLDTFVENTLSGEITARISFKEEK